MYIIEYYTQFYISTSYFTKYNIYKKKYVNQILFH